MFKKKPNIKALAPLRSSDRRKIADQIISDYGIEVPSVVESDNGDNEQAAGGLTIGALRNSLLPEDALSARFITTIGAELKQVSGTVYAGTHFGRDQRILWVKIEERLIPTVYTLWQHPRLVPLLHTPEFVVEKLQHGSPLMAPGLAGGPPFPAKATKDAIVAIASIERPSVPVVIGICEIDIASLTKVQGAKGHAVRSEHWEGDELWAWSASGNAGIPGPDTIDAWILTGREAELHAKTAKLAIEDDRSNGEEEDGGILLKSEAPTQPKSIDRDQGLTGEDAEPFERVANDADLSTKEIDDKFWHAFLYGVRHTRDANKGIKNHGLQFPIPQSLVVSNLVLPFLPIFTSKQAAALQIKKTSWKNAKKFIKALEKAKILKAKDRDGGECVVLDIDFEDSAITDFVPYKLPKKDTPGAESGGGGGGKPLTSGTMTGDSSIGQRLTKINLLRPKDALSPIFGSAQANTGMLFAPTELRSTITSYIETEKLISDSNKRLVKLNPVLANAVFDGRSSMDREVIAKGSVPRDALIERLQQACSPFWAILRNDESRDSVKAKAGHGPKILIVLETRSGNKTVTKTSGLETFYISPQLLADELQKACASSTSVNQLAGSSPKQPVMEILVQGPQKDAVIKALEKRGVSRGWIEVNDKTKGKKRG